MFDQPTCHKYTFAGILQQITPATEEGTNILLREGWSTSKEEAMRIYYGIPDKIKPDEKNK
jgi:hypothetical protein